MKNYALLSLVAAAAVLAYGANKADASTLYASVGVANGTDDIYTINQSTGAATLLGSTNLANSDINDLASDNTSTLYGADTANGNLVTINPNTGAGTVVGAFTPTTAIYELAYHVTGGTAPLGLYGNVWGAGDELYSINPTTAAVTDIGPIGFSTLEALAFDNNGNLFGVDGSNNLISIDPTTGAGTLIGALNLSGSPVPDITDIAARPEDNVMFAAAATGDIYTIDTSNGDLTDIGPPDVGDVFGLAFLGSSVPEPTSLGVLGLGGLALIGRRRKVSRA